jgi:hypothetical protein
VVRKIQWRLCKAEELTSFRLRVTSHVQTIDMLPTAFQASVKYGYGSRSPLTFCLQITTYTVSTQAAPAQEQEMKYQSKALSNVAGFLNTINQSFEHIKTACAKSGCLHEQVLTSIESTKQLLMYVFIGNVEFIRMI